MEIIEETLYAAYDPVSIKNQYDDIPHGKTRMAAIKSAIEEADRNKDVTYMIYFREDLCDESCFYGDETEMMVIFPEILSLIDRYPDTPSTQFDTAYKNATEHVLWVYKWVVGRCSGFYQIPMEDCMKFFEDFKRRSIAYGFNLKPYYRLLYGFYHFDDEKSDEAFYNLDNGYLDEADEIAYLLEHNMNDKTEYQAWDDILRCYSYTRPGRALRVYKKHWKMWQEGTSPADEFSKTLNVCCFWKKYIMDTGKDTVKLMLDKTFPLYNEENIYNTEELYNYYYKRAEDIAAKFDKRNNADSYKEEMEEKLDIQRYIKCSRTQEN